MSDIPADLFSNILSRLPAESLLILRGVCKSWRRIIDDPDFIKSHFKHQSSNNGLGQLLVRNEMGGKLLCLSLDSLHFDSDNQSIEATYIKNLIRPGLTRLSTLPVASCNGLIVIADKYNDAKKKWVLWNPLTQEYYELPRCTDLTLKGCGLGYDCVNDDYKVVRINFVRFRSPKGESVCKTLIYSLKLDSWKQINDFPGVPLCHYSQRSQGLYLNGALYWLSQQFISNEFIVELDLTTDEYDRDRD